MEDEDTPRIASPLRPNKRQRLAPGDKVEWSYHPDHTQQGVVDDVTHGGAWAHVTYGVFATYIETVRLRVVRR